MIEEQTDQTRISHLNFVAYFSDNRLHFLDDTAKSF
jgi:hypothetical protein